MNKIDIITNIAPHYRSLLWRTILNSNHYRFRFMFGVDRKSNIRQIDFDQSEWCDQKAQLRVIKNVYFSKILIWQRGAVWQVLRTKAKAVIMLDMMYTVSTWICILVARLRGIRIVLWGHGYYGNERRLKRWVRLFYLRRADSILVYGSRARDLLIENGFDPGRIQVAFNSLDYDRHKALRDAVVDRDYYRQAGFFEDPENPVILFVGRLTAQKELDLTIDAVVALEPKANLIFVGDGPEKANLEKKAERLKGQVHFFGPCYDEFVLGRLIANADMCLSPGEVGLTAIHSLSYGTPVCTHDNFSHQMPEVEALEPGKTGVFFSHAKKNIAETLQNWLLTRPAREMTRQQCFETIDAKYNPYSQLAIFESAIQKLGIS